MSYAEYIVDQMIDGNYGPWPNRHRRRKSTRPLMTLHASADIRLMRQRAHRSFDRIWRRGHMSRNKAYSWLARQLKIDRLDAHMGRMMDRQILEDVIEVSDKYIGSTEAQDDFPDDLE